MAGTCCGPWAWGLTLQVLDDAEILGLGDGPQHAEGGLLPEAAAVLAEAGGSDQQRLELSPCEEACQPLRLAADVEQHLRERRRKTGETIRASLLQWACSHSYRALWARVSAEMALYVVSPAQTSLVTSATSEGRGSGCLHSYPL